MQLLGSKGCPNPSTTIGWRFLEGEVERNIFKNYKEIYKHIQEGRQVQVHRHTHTLYTEVGQLLVTGPRGEGPQMGLEIVSSMRRICRALIGCRSI